MPERHIVRSCSCEKEQSQGELLNSLTRPGHCRKDHPIRKNMTEGSDDGLEKEKTWLAPTYPSIEWMDRGPTRPDSVASVYGVNPGCIAIIV